MAEASRHPANITTKAKQPRCLPYRYPIPAHRPQLEQYPKLLLENISVWQEIASTPELEEAIGKIDEVITQITTPTLARRTRKETEQAEESAPPDVPRTA